MSGAAKDLTYISNIPLSQSTASSNPSPVSALVELHGKWRVRWGTSHCTDGGSDGELVIVQMEGQVGN